MAFRCNQTEEAFLKMDIRRFNCMVSAYVKNREIGLNDDIMVGHINAGKNAAAVWNDKSFSKPHDYIHLDKKEKKLKDNRRYELLAECARTNNIKREDALNNLRRSMKQNG